MNNFLKTSPNYDVHFWLSLIDMVGEWQRSYRSPVDVFFSASLLRISSEGNKFHQRIVQEDIFIIFA
jgi:hypothetical protein